MSQIFLWQKLSTCSRRAMLKTKKKYGQPYIYNPRPRLLLRLSRETGMSMDEIYNQLLRERAIMHKLRGVA
ncbi:hypothetical protein Lepto7376_3724 [[Leptolyngbya] sp. PCC 7376]|nr:hypothetical protein Lepto7376_3710 [[Leptolyngbya] sp. PCC 7376]AFY39900.1 hypothetical protein Lepto7376_3724 [[Leptolyngbya] sp. PCC 7376]